MNDEIESMNCTRARMLSISALLNSCTTNFYYFINGPFHFEFPFRISAIILEMALNLCTMNL